MGAILAVPFIMIFMQPDLGTSIVFVCIFLGMLWLGNIKMSHVLIGSISLSAIIAFVTGLYFYDFALFSKIVKPHQLHRVQTFLDPSSDPAHSWHVVNSISAISTGGMKGAGFVQGPLVQAGFIPYDYADSIFVVIGEEFGFVGSAVLILLYFLLIYRIIRIAISCEDLSGSYIVVGIISMFTVQIF